jgi:hypothetical protein
MVLQRNDIRSEKSPEVSLGDPRNIGFHATVITPAGLDTTPDQLRRVKNGEKIDLNARHYAQYTIGNHKAQIYLTVLVMMNDRRRTIRFERTGKTSYLAVISYLLERIS